MEIVRGRSVLKRTAVGRLQYYEKEEPSVVRRQVEDTERELSRYERAWSRRKRSWKPCMRGLWERQEQTALRCSWATGCFLRMRNTEIL